MIGLHVVRSAQPSSPTNNGARGPVAKRSHGFAKRKRTPRRTPVYNAMEAKPGFEPGVKALQASALPLGHFAVYAKGRLKSARHIQWSGQRGSNPRPQPWQGCALPTEPCPHVVGDTRFELVTPSVSGKCSPPELIARLRCAPQRGINYSRAEFQMQQHFSKFLRLFGFPW